MIFLNESSAYSFGWSKSKTYQAIENRESVESRILRSAEIIFAAKGFLVARLWNVLRR